MPIRALLPVLLLIAASAGCGTSRERSQAPDREVEARIAEARAREAEANARAAEAQARRAQALAASAEGPPDIDGPVLDEVELRTMPTGPESGCYPEGNNHTVVLVRKGYEGDRRGVIPDFYVLRDGRGVEAEYRVYEGLSNVTRGSLPVLMVEGRRLRVRFDQCGNGGHRYLTHLEPLPRSGPP